MIKNCIPDGRFQAVSLSLHEWSHVIKHHMTSDDFSTRESESEQLQHIYTSGFAQARFGSSTHTNTLIQKGVYYNRWVDSIIVTLIVWQCCCAEWARTPPFTLIHTYIYSLPYTWSSCINARAFIIQNANELLCIINTFNERDRGQRRTAYGDSLCEL